MFHAPTGYQVTNYVLPKHPKISGFSESFESQAIPATGDTKLDILEIAKHLIGCCFLINCNIYITTTFWNNVLCHRYSLTSWGKTWIQWDISQQICRQQNIDSPWNPYGIFGQVATRTNRRLSLQAGSEQTGDFFFHGVFYTYKGTKQLQALMYLFRKTLNLQITSILVKAGRPHPNISFRLGVYGKFMSLAMDCHVISCHFLTS